jgi:hypothetical protein
MESEGRVRQINPTIRQNNSIVDAGRRGVDSIVDYYGQSHRSSISIIAVNKII